MRHETVEAQVAGEVQEDERHREQPQWQLHEQKDHHVDEDGKRAPWEGRADEAKARGVRRVGTPVGIEAGDLLLAVVDLPDRRHPSVTSSII